MSKYTVELERIPSINRLNMPLSKTRRAQALGLGRRVR
jgi:hypothetical protein